MQDEIDLKQNQKQNPLSYVFINVKFFSGNLSWLRECLENRVGVNGLDKAGSTALYWACHGGHKGIAFCFSPSVSVLLKNVLHLGDQIYGNEIKLVGYSFQILWNISQ